MTLSKISGVVMVLIFALAMIGATMPAAAAENEYDLVILSGRVMDPETGLDAIRNVGIIDGQIVAVTVKRLRGRNIIFAKGLVVAPGFIDMHNHIVLTPFGQKLALRDGVTTPLELEAGVFPVAPWYNNLEGRSRTNYGASVGAMGIREILLNPKFKTLYSGDFMIDMMDPKQTHATMSWSTEILNDKQIAQLGKMLEIGFDQGALSIGYAAGYMVEGVTQRESDMIQKTAGEHGAFVALHGRFSSQNPPTTGILGMEELMAPQAAYGGGLVVQHITAQTLDLTPQALELIDDARKRGVQIVGEIYPYDFGATIVGADYLKPPNYQKNMGRDYKDIIETSTLKPLTKARYNELMKTAPATGVMFYNATKETVYNALAHPNTIVGSDAFTYVDKKTGATAWNWDTPYESVNGHPRGAGTHAKFLRLVREKDVDIPLMLAVSKMTYMIAKFMEDNGVAQMAHKGRIQVGADADITIFDPETVSDKSTMKLGALPSVGIPYVIVNGVVVVQRSKVRKDVFPGEAIRRPVNEGASIEQIVR